jgi:hypothetical protein
MDLKNAFNCISRDAVEQQLEDHVPLLLGYFRACYRCSGDLLAASAGHSSWLTSEVGVQQGDPLGPALFCIGFSKALQTVRT